MLRILLVSGLIVGAMTGVGAADQVGSSLRFVENCGQWPIAAHFVAERGRARVRLAPEAIGVQLESGESGVYLRFAFVGSSPDVALEPIDVLPTRSNYFFGDDPSSWVTEVSSCRRVAYRGLYPGLDLEAREGGEILRYDLHVAPGADASIFALRVEGADSMAIGSEGELVLETELGVLRHDPPIAFYTDTGESLPCRFELRGPSMVGFELHAVQSGRPVTIDPSLVMEWVTTIGSSFGDQTFSGNCVDIDASGIITLGGKVTGAGFPVTPGAYANSYQQDTAVIARFDPSLPPGDQLIYSTFVSSLWDDKVTGINVDEKGVITAAGTTEGQDFPTTGDAYDTTLAGEYDVFALRLDPSQFGAAQLLYSTYYGGSREDDIPEAIYRDGKLYLVGHTRSLDIPLTSDAYQTENAGPISSFGTAPADSYVAVLDLDQAGPDQLIYSSFFGGNNQWEVPVQVHVDANGQITWVGEGGGALPTTPNAMTASASYPGGCLVQFDPFATGPDQLVRSTYLGNGQMFPRGLHVDPSGVVTVGGYCESVTGLVPPGVPTIDPSFNGSGDGFVAQFDLSLPPSEQLIWGTYLGGTAADSVDGLAVDELGRILVTGRTSSAQFPVVPGLYDFSFDGSTFTADGFFAEIDSTASSESQLRASGFISNGAAFKSFGVAAAGGYVGLAGVASSAELIGSVAHGSTSAEDMFVARLLQCDLLGCCPPVSDLMVVSECDGSSVDVTWVNSSVADTIDLWVEDFDGATIQSFSLPPSSTSFVLDKNQLPDETLRVFVQPQCSGLIFPPVSALAWTYEGQSDIVVARESPGNHDTAAVITNGLAFHGRSVYTTHTLEIPSCFDHDAVENVWVCLGAGSGGVLTTEEGDFIHDVLQVHDKNVYIDGPRQFHTSSFNPTLLRDVDGVESALNFVDTQPAFTSVQGLDSAVGLDLTGFGTIGYTFDQSGFPETDRLTLATTENAGSAIGPLWVHPETGFIVGLFYNSINGGKLIGQSFELGGLSGDTNALIGAYLDAFALPEDPFWRGDCNGDGARDIGDVLTLLNTLFGEEGFTCPDACDSNDSGAVDLGDAIVALAKLFSGGGPFPEPSLECGEDPTLDEFRCAVQPQCP